MGEGSIGLLMRALYPKARRTTKRGALLDRIIEVRAMRAWTNRGCYAWWRFTGDIEQLQRALLKLRSPTSEGEAVAVPHVNTDTKMESEHG